MKKKERIEPKIKRGESVKQVTFDGHKHPSCGTVFSLRWDMVKKLFEKDFKRMTDEVISFKFDEYGITVFLDTEDSSHHYPMKVQG